MKKITLERITSPSPEQFERDYMAYPGRPVIVTDAIDAWPARTSWTFEQMRQSYGSDFVTVGDGSLSSGRPFKLTRFSDFIDYTNTPESGLPGFWVDSHSRPVRSAPEPSAAPFYLMGWQGVELHPELRDDMLPPPACLPDWSLALSPSMLSIVGWVLDKDLVSIYIGPTGTLSSVHQDFGSTHSYLAQVQGSKQVYLFSPDDSPNLYGGQVDPEHPDFEAFPMLADATAWHATLGPGELLYTPPNWWHYVRSLERSITVSRNFFNRINYEQHIAMLFENAPRLQKGLERNPEWKQEIERLVAGG